MSSNPLLRIVVAETSVILRSGLTAVLKRLPNLNVHPVEVTTLEALQNYVQLHPTDILIINPTFGGWFDLPAFKAAFGKPGIKYVALVNAVIDSNVLREYDLDLSTGDDLDLITTKINQLLTDDERSSEAEAESLSQREREIITCIVKGMTNKAIAEQLYLSIHTVITHRRNIARKLQIHSPAGLTIYAIVNKLVNLSDIKDTL